jgi:hypothetical protein
MTSETKTTLRPELTPLPPRMMHLPVDTRGYVVPWFVAWVNGEPEFRAVDARKWATAVKHKLCWVCGTSLGAYQAFVVGPMCLVNLTSSEPPSHLQCATWSAINCPFLSRPHMVRRENDLPELKQDPAGIMIPRNPGVTAVYTVRGFRIFKDGLGNPLIRMPEEYVSIEWWAEGRKATLDEIHHSINTGVPLLMELAEKDGPEAVKELNAAVRRLERWLA